MAWSSFAHLPTSEDEYWHILSKLESNMTIHEVDSIIALQKGKEKVEHHYRSNLARIGFFKIDHKIIILNYDVEKLISSKKHLKAIFLNVLKENQAKEIKEVSKTIRKINSYDLQAIVNMLAVDYPLIERNSFIRWIRPVVSIMRFADILSDKKINNQMSYTKYLQKVYLKITSEFGNPAPLEVLEAEFKKVDFNFEIISLLDKVLGDFDAKFKIELLMMPSWATKNKTYKINQDVYTHIKIKSDLLKED